MNKQDKFKCKHIQCDMDGNYCGINKGKGYNHCVLPHCQESCEYYEEENTTNKQIAEMAKDIGYELGKYYEEENLSFSLHTRDYLAKSLINLGYQKVDKDKQVVLSKERYDKLISLYDEIWGAYYDGENNAKVYYENIKIPQARKETAREILNKILDFIHYETFRKGFELKKVESKVKELAKQYGVEIKEQ